MSESIQKPRRRTLEFSIGLLVGLAMLVVGWMLAGWPGASGDESAAAAPASTASPAAPAIPRDEPSAASAMAHSVGSASAADRERIAKARVAVERGTEPRARQQLALALLAGGRFYEAHEEAQAILAADPGDLDGLYVEAAVRVRMGQPSRALPILDRLLESRPDHVAALVAKGRALEKAGHSDLALEAWQHALGVVGESAEIEALIRSLEEREVAAGT